MVEPPSNPNQTPRHQAQMAEASLDAGNFQLAEQRARDVLATDPASETGWRVLANARYKSNQHRLAIEASGDWVKANPASSSALYHLAVYTIVSTENKHRARALLDQFRSRFAERALECRVLSCFYEIEFGSSQKAMRLAEELVADHPEFSFLFTVQCAAYHRADRFDACYVSAKRVIEQDPLDVGAWRFLAISAFRTLRFPEAYSAARQGRALDPAMRIFPAIKHVSVVVWVPPLLFWQMMYRVGYYIAGESRWPDMPRQILKLIVGAAMAAPIILPLFGFLGETLKEADLFALYLPSVLVAIATMIYTEVFILSVDEAPVKHAAPVNVNRY